MRFLIAAATFGVGAWGQVTGLLMQVESPDFDVTQALLDRDVDIAKLPLADVSQDNACVAAVRHLYSYPKVQCC